MNLDEIREIPVREPEYHMSPVCRCGSRRTERVGHLQHKCHNCKRTFHYRLSNGYMIPLGKETAQAWDEERACQTP